MNGGRREGWRVGRQAGTARPRFAPPSPAALLFDSVWVLGQVRHVFIVKALRNPLRGDHFIFAPPSGPDLALKFSGLERATQGVRAQFNAPFAPFPYPGQCSGSFLRLAPRGGATREQRALPEEDARKALGSQVRRTSPSGAGRRGVSEHPG